MLSYGEGVAFYALAEAIRARLQNLHPDPDASFDETPDPSQLLEQGLAELALDPDERAWLQPRLGALLGVSAVGTYKREDLFAAWTTFLERLSDDGSPVVLVIEDAHHADDGLLGFVEHLLAVGSFPCFVVLLARPSLLEGRPTLATNRRATVLNLETLADREMSQLLDALVVGLPDAARSCPGGAGRGDPALCRGDGALPDRPGPGGAPRWPVRPGRLRRAGSGQRGSPSVAPSPDRSQTGHPSVGAASGDRPGQRAG